MCWVAITGVAKAALQRRGQEHLDRAAAKIVHAARSRRPRCGSHGSRRDEGRRGSAFRPRRSSRRKLPGFVDRFVEKRVCGSQDRLPRPQALTARAVAFGQRRGASRGGCFAAGQFHRSSMAPRALPSATAAMPNSASSPKNGKTYSGPETTGASYDTACSRGTAQVGDDHLAGAGAAQARRHARYRSRSRPRRGRSGGALPAFRSASFRTSPFSSDDAAADQPAGSWPSLTPDAQRPFRTYSVAVDLGLSPSARTRRRR